MSCECIIKTIEKLAQSDTGRRFGKSRSNLIMDTVRTGYVSKGNLKIEYKNEKLLFDYRGTAILEVGCDIENIDAGSYEHTTSTYTQRKAIREAIGEIIDYAKKTKAWTTEIDRAPEEASEAFIPTEYENTSS